MKTSEDLMKEVAVIVGSVVVAHVAMALASSAVSSISNFFKERKEKKAQEPKTETKAS